jgi:hypothetical protein
LGKTLLPGPSSNDPRRRVRYFSPASPTDSQVRPGSSAGAISDWRNNRTEIKSGPGGDNGTGGAGRDARAETAPSEAPRGKEPPGGAGREGRAFSVAGPSVAEPSVAGPSVAARRGEGKQGATAGRVAPKWFLYYANLPPGGLFLLGVFFVLRFRITIARPLFCITSWEN